MSQQFRAMVVDRVGEGVDFGSRQLSEDDLPGGDVLVRVEYSSVNYKDALATTASGKVASTYPLIPGIDLAGKVLSAPDRRGPKVGAQVVAIGYGLGVSRHGGYAELARLPSEWVVELPENLSAREAMAIGTAGFTAGMSVARVVEHGVGPTDGPVLVTGASGGVGSTAVAVLAGLGYDVIASSGKPAAAPMLRELGASEVIDRTIGGSEEDRPLAKQRWAAAVDCVGGATLAGILSRTCYGGIVATTGLTGGAALSTTVLPFILRGVTLAGIDSVQVPIAARRDLWHRLASDLYPRGLNRLVSEVALEDVGAALHRVRTGRSTGRTVVMIGGPSQ